MHGLIFYILFLVPLSWSRVELIGGLNDEVHNKNGVVELLMYLQNNKISTCTATKISQRHLITAAHCFFKTKILALSVSNKTINLDGKYTPLEYEKIHVHPSYTDYRTNSFRSQLTGPDVAIIEVIPNQFFKEIDTVEIDYKFIPTDQEIEIWGYGCQKKISDYSDKSVRKKGISLTISAETLEREDHKNKIDNHYHYRSYLDEMYRMFILSKGKMWDSKSVSLCPGDSGGPALRKGKLVGIASYYLFSDIRDGQTLSGVSSINMHVRISAISDWLGKTMALWEK